MRSTFSTIWNIFTTLLVIVVLILAIALVGVRLVGLQPMTVLSGSMEPSYPVGSLIYVKEVDYRELKPGDVITFMLNESTMATHRIVEVVPDEDDPDALCFRTKGDANNTEDGGLVPCRNIIGSPVFMIPKLGYLANYIQSTSGTFMTICVGAILLLLMLLPELIGGLFGKKEKTLQTEPEEKASGEMQREIHRKTRKEHTLR